MTDQLQTAKEWLGDLNKVVSRQKTKEDYEYTKKRTDLMEWLINRVEELEKENRRLNFEIGSYAMQVSEISQMVDREVKEMEKLSNRMVKGESK